MDTKNVKVLIWLGLVVALLLSSSQVLTEVEATEKNGAENLKYGASLAGLQCGSPGCCRFRSVSPKFVPTCIRCCTPGTPPS
ncbi:hypothetical protein MKX03_021942 [Papaver bracteatum]|nr:hypothetical protein MKX03_021942 [Papaver bracteatum]